MNERTNFFIKIYISQHFILERVDVGCVSEVSWRRRQTATYWPQVLLTIEALLSHSSWAAQPWVTEGPKPSVCCWLSIPHLVPNWLQLQLTATASCGRTHLPPSPNSTTSTGHGDIPISSTGCTCSAVFPLIYPGKSLDWRPSRGSICNISISSNSV